MSNLKEAEGIKRNVRRLSSNIYDVYLKNEEEKFSSFRSDYNLFIMQIEGLYKSWFPKAKTISDIDIINHLYKDIFAKDEKQYVKYGTQCLLKSTTRVFEEILSAKEINNQDLLIANMQLLREISFEAVIFLDLAFKIMKEPDIDFGHGKRFKLEPRETFKASKFILRRYNPKRLIGDYAIAPTSTFLIRQAIEIWLQDIFGIHSVWDDAEKKFIKLQPERLFELIDNKFMKLPIQKASIQKIHSWTQRYVHSGLMNHAWEVEHAQFVLEPLFNSNNVIISEKYYNNIEVEIQKILKNPNLRLNRKTQYSSKVVDKIDSANL